MTIKIDPEENELRALRNISDWRNQRVLEIGCGEGRLTLRLARLGAKMIHAIDPSVESIRTARKNLPARFADRIRYKTGKAEKLKHPPASFDMVVFSWVL